MRCLLRRHSAGLVRFAVLLCVAILSSLPAFAQEGAKQDAGGVSGERTDLLADDLAAAHGCLYVSTADGKVLALVRR